MTEWFESMAGPAYAPALMWTALALLALVVILIAVKLFRSLTAGTFIAGGRNRRARLAVMDATAIDNQRRLVLVRRDDVEHLILIGGASDLVIERDIGANDEASRGESGAAAIREVPSAAPDRPAPAARTSDDARAVAAPTRNPQAAPTRPSHPSRPTSTAPTVAPAAESVVPPVAAAPRAAAAPLAVSRPVPSEPRFEQPSAQPTVQPAPTRPSAAPEMAAIPEPVRAEGGTSRDTVSGTASAGPAIASTRSRDDADLDDALLEELELTLEEDERRSPTPGPDATRGDPDLDDEMDRLLGELSGERR
ncbi:hypothetical protein GRZ55_12375 [Chelativorans sp. ZYF759]|uniref:flagellar biosynthetic protein FliO n=1 Tax=Chelativorans sp. ZYF759 TaxID=2692213 RepID=UPI00145CEC62|nr:flagellar biosynthetic protein FliO [Chelativorans sp. ZYF759]NMG40038.1 hypothetical protein [Chelativorans sp. ZYF759]